MIRGTTAQFKFHTPYDFRDLCLVEVTFWQPGNNGTVGAPLPIVKIYNRPQLVTVDVWPLPETADDTKVYYYKTTDGEDKYYKKEGDEWIESETINTFTTNDGIAEDADDSKTILTSLTPEQTSRFSDKCKGRVQITAYCETRGIAFASKPESFMVYPNINGDIMGDISSNEGVRVLDAGELE